MELNELLSMSIAIDIMAESDRFEDCAEAARLDLVFIEECYAAGFKPGQINLLKGN